jgi:vacuolar-type H+-ATPase subunit D/Vma8
MRNAASILANFQRHSLDASILNIFHVNHPIITIQQNSPFPKESHLSSSALLENQNIT